MISRRVLAIAIGVTLVAAASAAAIILFGSSAPTAPCTLPPPAALSHDSALLLIPCGATVNVRPHSFVSYTMVRLSDQMIVIGEFFIESTPNGTAGAFLLNSTEFSELLANSSTEQLPSEYFWSSPPGPICNVSVSIPGSPAQFFVALVNVGPTAFATEWPHGFVLYYGPG